MTMKLEASKHVLYSDSWIRANLQKAQLVTSQGICEALQSCKAGDWAAFSSAQLLLQIRLAMDLNEMG